MLIPHLRACRQHGSSSPLLCKAQVHVGEDVRDAAGQHVVEARVLLQLCCARTHERLRPWPMPLLVRPADSSGRSDKTSVGLLVVPIPFGWCPPCLVAYTTLCSHRTEDACSTHQDCSSTTAASSAWRLTLVRAAARWRSSSKASLAPATPYFCRSKGQRSQAAVGSV